MGEVFHALCVEQQAFDGKSILCAGAFTQSQQLQAGFKDGDGGLELVGGVAGELTLSLEGLLQAEEQGTDRGGDGFELASAEGSIWWSELPRGGRDARCTIGELAQRCEAAAQEPCHDEAGKQQEKKTQQCCRSGQPLLPDARDATSVLRRAG